MDYLVKIRSVQTPLNGQFSIGANNCFNRPYSLSKSNDIFCYIYSYLVVIESNCSFLFLGWVAFLLINAIFTVQIELKLELALSL